MASDSSSEGAEALLALALARPPRLGSGRLVCLDGPAGAGKTTLARRLASSARRAGIDPAVVHLDDLYDGWSGLPSVPGQLAALLAPLAAGRPATYRRYDWHAGRYAEPVTVPPAPLLLLEGVGSGSAPAALVSLLVWLDAPEAERRRRVRRRDEGAMEGHWAAWAADEAEHFARHRTRARADVVLEPRPRR